MKNIFIIAAIFLMPVNFFSQPVTSHQSQITVRDAWVRPAAKNANSAIYFNIENKGPGPDTLLNVKSKSAEIVEVHESFKRDNDRIGMRQVKFVPLRPESVAAFAPGGFHVMLIGLYKDLKTGASIEATLNFKYAGKIKIKAAVMDASVK
jgi:copper(I)-binding protein